MSKAPLCDFQEQDQNQEDTGAEPMEQAVCPDQQNIPMLVTLSHLVNIPIHEADCSIVPLSLETNADVGVTAAKVVKASRRWRRAGGKENIRALECKTESQEYSSRAKRSWRLIDESEEKNEAVKGSSKKQKAFQDISNVQVVAASLKWPQMDQ